MKISIVLVSPSRAENVGAVARAMKTMGFTQLRIVQVMHIYSLLPVGLLMDQERYW